MSKDANGKITLPSFDHIEENISLWYVSFKARELVKGFIQGLHGVKEASLLENEDFVGFN